MIGTKGMLSFEPDNKLNLVKESLLAGFVIVIIPVGLGYLLVLNSLYIITLVFFMILFTAGAVSLVRGGSKGEEMISENTSDDEIKKMLKDRGLDQLISKEDSSED